MKKEVKVVITLLSHKGDKRKQKNFFGSLTLVGNMPFLKSIFLAGRL